MRFWFDEDLSPTLVQLARERHQSLPANGQGGSIHFTSGDMLDESLGGQLGPV